jgi:hypothetical protein
MSTSTPRFESTDLRDELPAPGFYPGTVTSARLRRSQSGNRMVHIVYTLQGIAARHDRLAEYFPLEGASPRGLAFSRRRLVELYRACGLDPRAGEGIEPADLLGARLLVRVEHDAWQGMPRLRAVGHQPLDAEEAAGANESATDTDNAATDADNAGTPF